MADPVSLAGVGLGSSLVGGFASAFGSEYSGKAAAGMYNYQAGVAQTNAALAAQDAVYAESAGEVEAQTSGMRTRAQVGQTRVDFAAGNIDASRGTASKVLSSETEIGQFEQAQIRQNAAYRAYGFNVKGAEDVAQAGAYKTAAATSLVSGDIGAVSSILGGVGSVSSKWSQASQSFGGGTSLPGGGGYSGMGGWNSLSLGA